MEGCVKDFLQKKGYTVNVKAMEVIQTCDDWYSNRVIENFHKRKTINGIRYELNRLNFGKRCCSDDANLCEVLEINGFSIAVVGQPEMESKQILLLVFCLEASLTPSTASSWRKLLQTEQRHAMYGWITLHLWTITLYKAV